MTGLRDMLTGVAGFDHSVYKDRLSTAHVLPVGHEPASPEAMDISRLRDIADALESNYDFLVFDCGYTGPDGLNSMADANTLVVISCEGSEAEEAKQFDRRFQGAGYQETIVVAMDSEDRNSALAAA